MSEVLYLNKRQSDFRMVYESRNNRWLGWKRITQNVRINVLARTKREGTLPFSMEDKMAAGAFGRARNYG